MQLLLKMLVMNFEEVRLEKHYKGEQEVVVEKQQELELVGGFAEGQMTMVLELNYFDQL